MTTLNSLQNLFETAQSFTDRSALATDGKVSISLDSIQSTILAGDESRGPTIIPRGKAFRLTVVGTGQTFLFTQPNDFVVAAIRSDD